MKKLKRILLLFLVVLSSHLVAQIPYQDGFPIIFETSKAIFPLVTEDINPNFEGKEILAIIGGYFPPVSDAGKLVCYSSSGSLIFENELNPNHDWNYAPKPVVGDIDNDGTKEIVILCRNQNLTYEVKIFRFDGSNYNNGWPLNLPSFGWNISIGDIDNDGDLEIAFLVQGVGLCVYHHDATIATGWPKAIPAGYHSNCWSPPLITDLNCDNEAEIIFFVNHVPPNQSSRMYVLDGQGNDLAGWPIDFPLDIIWKTPCVADINTNNNSLEIIMSDHSYEAIVYAFNLDGSQVQGWPVTLPNIATYNQPDNCLTYEDSLGNRYYDDLTDYSSGGSLLTITDLEQNGSLQIIAAGHNQFDILNQDGSHYEPFPYLAFSDRIIYSPAVADINNDNELDIIFTSYSVESGDFKLTAYSNTGDLLDNYPILIKNYSVDPTHFIVFSRLNTPTIDDIDYDGDLEILVTGRSDRDDPLERGRFVVYDTQSEYDIKELEWRTTYKNNWNRNAYCQTVAGTFGESSTFLWYDRIQLLQDVIIPETSFLKICNYTRIDSDNHEILIDGATLIIEEGVFYCGEGSAIKVEEGGSFIAIGTESDPILFTSLGEEPWVGIELLEAEESHLRYCKIENAETGVLLWYANNETFMNNEINNCNIGLLAKGDVSGSRDIESNDFNNNKTGIFLHHIGSQLPNTLFYVDHNTIVGDEGDGIYLNHCGRELKIGDNTITNNKYGIRLEYSDGCELLGSDSDDYLIEENYVGVCFYQSTVDMKDLTINNNEDYGLVFLSDSHPTILSNRIINNGTYELYCNYGHPVMADGHNDIVHTSAGYLGYLYRDNVRSINCCYNWWGSYPPDPERFYPYGDAYFKYDPWDESSNHPLPGTGTGEDSDARIAYKNALEAEGNEDYSSAAVMYSNIIDTYPLSEEALLSLRRLFICEKNAYGNMYYLKLFYEELANSCPEDTVFCLLSRNLAIDCDKENELYEDVLLQYSDILESPIDEADSIFTQINIMSTLLEIEGFGRNTICLENLPENIRRLNPADVQDFQIKSQNLLDNLLGELEPEPEEEPISNNTPELIKLHKNFPNPFNPTTVISFSIPEESKVDLSIYNIKGQKVKSLVKESFESGNHSVIWDGNDDTDKSVSSGVYFYKLKVNGKSESVKKCLLLK